MALSPLVRAEVEDIISTALSSYKIQLDREDVIPLVEKEVHSIVAKATEPLPVEKKKAVFSAVVAATGDDTNIVRFLKKYGSPGRAMKPILLIGDQGSGKTTEAMQFAYFQPFDEVIEMPGDEGVDAQQMKGGIRPYPEAGGTTTVWQDGELARAFRLAAEGKKVCLVIDELFRIKVRNRSPLISGLSPFRMPDGTEYYRIKTDRVMEVKEGLVTNSEIIRAPRHLVTIIATTNVGAAFDVQAGDPAEAGRWLIYYLQSTEERVRFITTIVLKERGFSVSLVPKFVKLLQEGKKLKADNFLALDPDIRILCDAIKMSTNEMDIGNTLLDAGLVWVGRTIEGKCSPEQFDQLRNLVERHFPIKPLKGGK